MQAVRQRELRVRHLDLRRGGGRSAGRLRGRRDGEREQTAARLHTRDSTSVRFVIRRDAVRDEIRCDVRQPRPLVGVIMGSKSDWETMRQADEILTRFGVPHECRVVSAHRTPALDGRVRVDGAAERGLEVIIAGAGGAAHLPGMVAAHTVLPVIGVPVQSAALNGLDSLLSIVQMPKGVPVATRRHRPGGRGQRRPARGRDSRDVAARAARRSCRRTATSMTADGPSRHAARDVTPRRFRPGSTIGVLGGGQLGRMFAIAARRLGYRVHTLSPGARHAHRPDRRRRGHRVVRRSRRRPRVRAAGRRRHLRVRERPGGGGRPRPEQHAIVRPTGARCTSRSTALREKTFLAEHGLAGRAVRAGRIDATSSRRRSRRSAARRCSRRRRSATTARGRCRSTAPTTLRAAWDGARTAARRCSRRSSISSARSR